MVYFKTGRYGVRTRGWCLLGRSRSRQANCRPSAPRAGRYQWRAIQSVCALWRIQAIRHRTGTWTLWLRRVLAPQIDTAAAALAANTTGNRGRRPDHGKRRTMGPPGRLPRQPAGSADPDRLCLPGLLPRLPGAPVQKTLSLRRNNLPLQSACSFLLKLLEYICD